MMTMLDAIQFKDSGHFSGMVGHSCDLELKQVSEDGEFEGYGCVYGNVDRHLDIVQMGAFDEDIAIKGAKGIKMLWQHSVAEVIGVWTEIKSDQKGIYCKGRLLREIPDGAKVHSLMKAGAIDGLSIGYRTKERSYNEDTGVRTIIKGELWEISAVTFPANEAARVEAVKADQRKMTFNERFPTIRALETHVRDELGAPARLAKAMASAAFKDCNVRDELAAENDFAVFSEVLRERQGK